LSSDRMTSSSSSSSDFAYLTPLRLPAVTNGDNDGETSNENESAYDVHNDNNMMMTRCCWMGVWQAMIVRR
jgi:hypothetical protein